MNKIPKRIVDMIEERNRLNREITEFVNNEIGNDVYWNTDQADIVGEDNITGDEQGDENCREWCDQTMWGEDCGCGFYYWETEVKGKILRMDFEF